MFKSVWTILFLTDLHVCSCSQHNQAQHCCHGPEGKESAKIQSCFSYTGAQIQNITSGNTLAPRQLKWKQHIQLATNQHSAKEHLQQLCAEHFFHKAWSFGSLTPKDAMLSAWEGRTDFQKSWEPYLLNPLHLQLLCCRVYIFYQLFISF